MFALRRIREVDSEVSNLAFHDLTSDEVSLPPALKRLLGLNLNYCPTPPPIKPEDLQAALPHLVRTLRLKNLFNHSDPWPSQPRRERSIYVPNSIFQPPPCKIPGIESALHEIDSKLQICSWTSTKRLNLNPPQRSTLKALQFRPDLQVILTDKNLGPAVMTRAQ